MKSWKPEVIADSSGKWCSNALRFATKAEADRSASDLMDRWMLVTECRATESIDPITHAIVDGKLTHVGDTEVSQAA